MVIRADFPKLVALLEGEVQGSLLPQMETNKEDIDRLTEKLINGGFEGSTSDGFQTVMGKLRTELGEYNASLKKLNVEVQRAIEALRQADIDSGNRFV